MTTIEQIAEWRKSRYDAGLPCGFDDFFVVTGTCRVCKGTGKVYGIKRDTGGYFRLEEPLPQRDCPSCKVEK